MSFDPANPLIVQSDRTVLLETAAPLFDEARDALSVFAELVKSPEHIHTYRISPLSLWNAASLGMDAPRVVEQLTRFSKYPVPQNLVADIEDFMRRYGRLKLIEDGDDLYLTSVDPTLLMEVTRQKSVIPFLDGELEGDRVMVKRGERGFVKSALIRVGFPVEDLAGYVAGEPMEIKLQTETSDGQPFGLREYQRHAVDAFWASGGVRGGSGTIVLPCGAGKTVVGIGAMHEVAAQTLILTTNTTALRQWRDELLDKTCIDPEDIGEYSGATKEIKPVTITTYQILTYRKAKDAEFEHFHLFNSGNWGLIIYDEVHLLPAPVFRAVANLQSRRRLGLTATLVREDGKEEEVFSLIGPKKYDVPWRVLEKQGWIATAECTEIRVPFINEQVRLEYAIAEPRDKYRVAATNVRKLRVIRRLLDRHQGEQVLIIGQYLDQLAEISEMADAPIITGQTPQWKRDELYELFRSGQVGVLVVSKVANFAVDLPDASVAIQVSGTFGSRQEEAQRLGRVLRPKRDSNTAHFYSVVTRDSNEQEFSSKRQLFLTEQGYRYNIVAEE